MKQLLSLSAILPLVVFAAEVKCSSMKVTLDEKSNGAVVRMVSAKGVELGAVRGSLPLFTITATKPEDFAKTVEIDASKAKEFGCEAIDGGMRLVYGSLGDQLEKVVCTVRDGQDGKIRWGISIVPKAGWAIEKTAYPVILAAEKIGGSVDDDCLVGGNAKGGIFRGAKGAISARMPGSLVCQFSCLYDDSALFYYAAEDGRGYDKLLNVNRVWNGVKFQWTRVDFETGEVVQAYDVVTAAIDGSAERPCKWHDAADLYRKWALKQSWSRVKFLDRPDIPAWMKDAPTFVRFNRNMIGNPDSIRTWMKDYWKKYYPESPLIMAYWGWEKNGYWVSDYFPVYPSNEAFGALVKDCKAMGGHAFPWPSGYYWILDYDKQVDGTFKFNDHAAYERRHGDDFCCINRDGKPYRRAPRWLRGGSSTCLCGGTQFCQDWWNKEVCLPLAQLGCEMIQADQTVGGAFQPCWSRKHGHTPGDGLWKRDVFYKQMVTMRETMRTCEKDSVVCFEEPCELYNDVVGIQDYRTCEAQCDEWASVFNYVYHEYLPCFQSNPRRYDRVWQSHSCADGQMPFLSPYPSDTAGPHLALANGGFDKAANGGFDGWGKLDGYNGVQWKGRQYVDTETKHNGASSMRLECAKGEVLVQVSQNVGVCPEFAVGRRYRLSAWVKTGRKSGGNTHIGLTFLKNGNGSSGAGSAKALEFPDSPEAGWKLAQSEFTVPKDAVCLRIMSQAGEGSQVWVDSMKLEEILKDGSEKEVVISGLGPYDAFMRQWITLYHGEARKYLAYGKHIRPPELYCGTQDFSMMLYGASKPFVGKRPVVFHSAFEAADGTKAAVFVNATDKWQSIGWRWKGEAKALSLAPDQIKIVNID